VIDRLRAQIQQRLEQLSGEADRLRQALAALDPRPSASPAKRSTARKPAARTSTPKPRAAEAKPARPPATSEEQAPAPRRAAQGATRAAVLAALADGEALTASQVAERTGLGRGSVSTTLSKLAKSGAVQRAERGYRLTAAEAPAPEPTSA
jgi:DNA-binding transcriptional ArsR family regulator